MRYVTFLMLLFGSMIFSCSSDDDGNDMIPDPCEGIICQNDGECINGICDCGEMWEGPDCSNQVLPRAIEIIEFRVYKFPATDNGTGWDLTSRADIYWCMYDDQNNIEFCENNIYNNADANSQYNWTYSSLPIRVTDLSHRYRIWLWDSDDFDDDDAIVGVEFDLYNSENRFPESLILDANNGLRGELFLKYNF